MNPKTTDRTRDFPILVAFFDPAHYRVDPKRILKDPKRILITLSPGY